MYTSSAYGRPVAGAQQPGVQYPGAPQGMQYPGMQPQFQQPQQPQLRQQPQPYSPYAGSSQPQTGSSLAPKPIGGPQDGMALPLNATSPTLQTSIGRSPAAQPQPPQVSARELALEAKVRQLEQTLAEKDAEIQDLRSTLANARQAIPPRNSARGPPGRSGSGFRRSQDSSPVIKYQAVDQDDPIDIRLEEFYNTTNSAIPFKRINKGFYRFGDSVVELEIINHKLMAKTEDGWNRGKFGPVERFLTYYEDIERERMRDD